MTVLKFEQRHRARKKTTNNFWQVICALALGMAAVVSGTPLLDSLFIDPVVIDKKRAEVVYVYDGDTITVSLDGTHKTERVRLLGIDTAELKGASCSSEYNLALRQRDLLDSLVGNYVELKITGRDKYNRLLAIIYNEQNENVNELMLEQGQARRYSGGHRRGWCI